MLSELYLVNKMKSTASPLKQDKAKWWTFENISQKAGNVFKILSQAPRTLTMSFRWYPPTSPQLPFFRFNYKCSKRHNHPHSRLTSTFLDLGWSWTGDDCPPHPSILRYNKLISSTTKSLHYFLGSTPNPISPTSRNTHPSALFTCPNYFSLLFLNLTKRWSTPHISATSQLDLPSCLSLLPRILVSCNHICVEHPSIYLSIPMLLLYAVEEISYVFEQV